MAQGARHPERAKLDRSITLPRPIGQIMILEGIVTTISPEGVLNLAPMGPAVDEAMNRLLLRPYQTAQTYRNLKAHGEGVFHITDDVLLLAQAAIGAVEEPPACFP